MSACFWNGGGFRPCSGIRGRGVGTAAQPRRLCERLWIRPRHRIAGRRPRPCVCVCVCVQRQLETLEGLLAPVLSPGASPALQLPVMLTAQAELQRFGAESQLLRLLQEARGLQRERGPACPRGNPSGPWPRQMLQRPPASRLAVLEAAVAFAPSVAGSCGHRRADACSLFRALPGQPRGQGTPRDPGSRSRHLRRQFSPSRPPPPAPVSQGKPCAFPSKAFLPTATAPCPGACASVALPMATDSPSAFTLRWFPRPPGPVGYHRLWRSAWPCKGCLSLSRKVPLGACSSPCVEVWAPG